jgi:hypothetical protein
MSTIDSDTEPAEKKVPLTGDNLEAAIRSMESPKFFEKLTLRIVKLAEQKGFFSPFRDDVDLPGGESAGGLAHTIVQKALEGTFTWNTDKHPDFYRFCCSRAESILSNLLEKNERITILSPLEEEDTNGETQANLVSHAIDGRDIYEILRSQDGGRLGDQLLADFALSVEHEHDQAILIAVHDDRECISRTWCRAKLRLSESHYDAAMKRIRRAGPAFFRDWCIKNNVKLQDKQEIK